MVKVGNKLKLIKVFDITTKIIIFIYEAFSLFYLYQVFLFESCYDENLKNIVKALNLYTECGEGIAVAVTMFYSAMIGMSLLCLLPVMIGLRVVVYFWKKQNV